MGLEIVTVALETRGMEKARRWIEAAKPLHPSVVDQAHSVDELFGVVNVPNGIWIDETGTIVRPPETAYPTVPGFLREMARTAAADAYQQAVMEESQKIRIQPRRYMNGLRDWVAKGKASRYALSPDEVVARSRSRPAEAAEAAAQFELAQHPHRAGFPEDAIPHFRAAHTLQPENWTYKRQAWSIVDRNQGPSDVYDSDWLTDVRKIGAENYYERLDMPEGSPPPGRAPFGVEADLPAKRGG